MNKQYDRNTHARMTHVVDRNGLILASFVYSHQAIAHVINRGAWGIEGLQRGAPDKAHRFDIDSVPISELIRWAEGHTR